MARTTIIQLTDDLTKRPVTPDDLQTVQITTRGRGTYELDVSNGTFEGRIVPLMQAGRKVTPTTNVVPLRPYTDPARRDKEQNRAMRVWWKANAGKEGVQAFNDRGRIPGTVEEAFQRHGGMPIPDPEPEAKPVATPRKRAAATKAGTSARKQGTRAS